MLALTGPAPACSIINSLVPRSPAWHHSAVNWIIDLKYKSKKVVIRAHIHTCTDIIKKTFNSSPSSSKSLKTNRRQRDQYSCETTTTENDPIVRSSRPSTLPNIYKWPSWKYPSRKCHPICRRYHRSYGRTDSWTVWIEIKTLIINS